MAQNLKEAEACLQEFKKLRDWHSYPMPETFYTTFNIPKPQPAEINEYLHLAFNNMFLIKDPEVETRAPAEGGVRQIELPPPPPVETVVISDQPKEAPEPVEAVPLEKITFRKKGKVDDETSVNQTQ